MSTGADLESAIASAAKHYQAVDRCELQKQHTPRLHSGTYQGRSSVDFKGWYRDDRIGHDGGRNPIYLEAKATSDGHVAFTDKGDGIREKQLEAMRDAVSRGIYMLLVIDFVPESEVIAVDVTHVVEFTAAPWRKSLDLKWARAFGEVAKVSVEGKNRRVWFLDTKPHELRDVSYYAVLAEKAKANNRIVELYPAEMKPSKKLADRWATRPAPNTPEHAEYIRKLADEGMRKQIGTAKWKPKRKGYGR